VIAVARPGPLDEAVIEVVVDRRSKDPIKPEDACLLVVLVLVPAAARNLDDYLDDVWKRALDHRFSVGGRIVSNRSTGTETPEGTIREAIAMPGQTSLDVISAGHVPDRRSTGSER
jgi:hypothetical protein